jgi:hypothetical protein
MPLPRKIPKAPKRSNRWRSPAHLNFVRGHECSMKDCLDRPIEAAHVRFGSGAGMGQKPDDWRAVSLCKLHHAWQHRIGEPLFWDGYEKETGESVDDLISQFCEASPKAAEIRKVRMEAVDNG